MNRDLVAYALEFTSFLMQNLDEKDMEDIKDVILFGSVSRGDATRQSDVDIFINVFRKGRLENIVSSVVKRFYESKAFSHWKLMGIENQIKCIIGKMNEWKDLKASIIANGISLYGKYRGMLKAKSFAILYWDKVKPESKRVLLSKKLYGYAYRGKKYIGILDGMGTEKLGSNCLLVPIDEMGKVSGIFKNLGITKRAIYVSKNE